MNASRPEPFPDELTAPFWDAIQSGKLVVQRCTDCGRYQHPPESFCLRCRSTDLDFAPVSGAGRVYSYTETQSGARHPAFAAATPYLVGLVELVEQENLLMYTNFPGATLSQMIVGADVVAVFEPINDHFKLLQFRLADTLDEETAIGSDR